MAGSSENPASSGTPLHDGPELSATLYRELRRVASARMRFERPGHTLQPTALVNEAYLRMMDEGGSVWGDRSRVLGLAAHIMRNILVDHARAHRAGKRGAGAIQITFDEDLVSTDASVIDILAIDSALTGLSSFDERQARIIELHFFGGLTFEEIAAELDLSVRTVKRDWTMARAWLRTQLAPAP